MRIRRTLVLLAFSIVPSTIAAQGACPALQAGSTVRVHSPAAAAYTVRESVQPSDTVLALAPVGGAGTASVRCADVERAQLRVGRQSRLRSGLRGARLGLVVGAVGGAVLGYADWQSSPDFQLFSRSESMLLGAYVIGMAGAATGGVIGFLAPAGQWEDVSTAPRASSAPAAGLRIAPAGTSQVRVSYTLPL